jgi:hypothetical protein
MAALGAQRDLSLASFDSGDIRARVDSRARCLGAPEEGTSERERIDLGRVRAA